MSANVDKVLAALDAGLQSSEEHGYPERVDHPDLCARCLLHEPATDADLCGGCRAFLLGDSDVDPRRNEHTAIFDDPYRSGDTSVSQVLLDWMRSRGSEHAQATEHRLLAEIEDRDAWDSLAVSMNISEEEVDALRSRFVQAEMDALASDPVVYPDLSRMERDPAWEAHYPRFHATSPVRVQRLDRDGVPTGEPEELSGYVVHHLNGDSRDNRIENLRIVPARENVARFALEADYTVSWRQQGTMILWEYTIDGQSGAYLTDDRRGFSVRPFTDGTRRGGELLDADGYVRHVVWHEDYLPELADAPHPAAFRVASGSDVPEYYAVTCVQCRTMYAVDPERCTEGREIMAREGHGLGGWCTERASVLHRDYYVDGHGDVHTSTDLRRDWQAEAYAWLRQIVAEARQRLGL